MVSIPDTMTREQFEVHMKQASSSVHLRNDEGDLVAVVRYDYGYPGTPWIYNYIGDCGRYALDKAGNPYCAAWLNAPYQRRFASLEELSFFVAFVGLEYT